MLREPTVPSSTGLVDQEKLALLSPREGALLAMASRGFLDKEIAVHLNVSENTLRTYWKRIRVKVGGGSRVELSAAFIRHQLDQGVPMVGGEPASWELDLRKWTIVYYDPFVPDLLGGVELGTKVDFNRVLALFHPEDMPKIRSLLLSVRDGHVPSFVYRARYIAPQGIGITCALVEVLREEYGKADRIRGRRIPFLDLTLPSPGNVVVGHCHRNLRTGEIRVDDGTRIIFRLTGYERDIRSALLARCHPDDRRTANTYIDDMIRRGFVDRRMSFQLIAEEDRYRWVTTDTHLNYDSEGPESADVTIMAYH